MGVKNKERAGQRSLLAITLLVACGSRSGLLGGGEEPIFGPSQPSGAGGVSATGGTPTGGVAHAGKSAGGKGPTHGGNFPTIGGEPTAQGGEFPLPEGGTPSFAGAPNDEPTEVIWGKRFGDTKAEQTAAAIAVEPVGTFTITGTVTGNVDFGGGKLVGGGGRDAYLAQFDSDGEHRWSAVYGDAGTQEGAGVSVRSDGRLAVVGSFSGAIDFGNGWLGSHGNRDAFVAELDHDGKNAFFTEGFGDSDYQIASGVTFAESGLAVWAGAFRGSGFLGVTSHTSVGSVDALVAAHDDTGKSSWAMQAGNQLAQRANAIAGSDVDGSVFVAGNMLGQLKFGACSQVTGSATVEHGFIAWIDGSGNCNRNLVFNGNGASQAVAVATGKSPLSSLVAVGGHFVEDFSFAGVTAVDSTLENDAFVAVLEGNRNSYSFSPVYLTTFGGAGSQQVNGLAFDSQDNLLVVGEYDGEGAGVGLPSTETSHAFVVKYDSSGKQVWSKSFGGAGARSSASTVGLDSDDNIYVAGSFEGTMALSTGALASAGHDDIFVVKLAP
ncbi:MAG TPA: SBBP repeat-containing protein [Polyangiaceae bacterium]|nr:SBBP repeat-containing protein [Polyangiaceae bacterium]